MFEKKTLVKLLLGVYDASGGLAPVSTPPVKRGTLCMYMDVDGMTRKQPAAQPQPRGRASPFRTACAKMAKHIRAGGLKVEPEYSQVLPWSFAPMHRSPP